jgi:uncharacterized protein
MFRVLAILTAALLAGCGHSGSPSKSMSDSVIPVQAGDPEMEAAMQTARDQFPEFWRVIAADYKRVIPVYAGAMVKAYFFDTSAPQAGEHMWVRGIEYDGRTISGTLADTPGHISSVRTGQQVRFPLERLSDWFYVQDGKVVGAFTVKLLRKRMGAEERRTHDSHYPFRFE